ncbi:MAG: glycosyltransferase family 4 protein, partial [Candidatus Micrarchaeia archaeon]
VNFSEKAGVNRVVSAWRIFWALWKLRKETDILHIGTFRELAAVWSLKQFGKFPTLYTVHWMPYVPASYSKKDLLEENFKKSRLKGFLLKKADAVNHICKYWKKRVEEDYGVYGDVVYHGVDTETFKPSEKKPSEKVVVLTLGSNFGGRPMHGADIFFRVARRIARKKKNVEFRLYGANNENLRIPRELRKNFVKMYVSREELPRHIAQGDIFLLTSVFNLIPMSLLEAMSCGLPPVAFAIGGMPEVIGDGKDGFLIKDFDEEEMYDRILELAEEPDKRILMGRKARERIVEEFNLQRFWDGYRKIYERIGGIRDQ